MRVHSAAFISVLSDWGRLSLVLVLFLLPKLFVALVSRGLDSGRLRVIYLFINAVILLQDLSRVGKKLSEVTFSRPAHMQAEKDSAFLQTKSKKLTANFV